MGQHSSEMAHKHYLKVYDRNVEAATTTAIDDKLAQKLENKRIDKERQDRIDLEPIQITRSIAAGCKARCLRCQPKMFSTWIKPRLRAFLSCRLGFELFARPHNAPVIRISSYYKRRYELLCGRNSVVECQLPKLNVVGSNPIARFFVSILHISTCPHY